MMTLDINWFAVTDWITSPLAGLRQILSGDHLIIVHPPENWSGGMLARYLREQGVGVGSVGMTDGEGDVWIAVDDPDKATAALERLFN